MFVRGQTDKRVVYRSVSTPVSTATTTSTIPSPNHCSRGPTTLGQELLTCRGTGLDRSSGRDERPESLIGPQLGLVGVMTMECMAGYAALADPTRCVEIAKID
jgi:hypothetical protein